jgi:hypothetical protein
MQVRVKLIDGTIECFPKVTSPWMADNYIRFFSSSDEILIPYRNILYWKLEAEN